MKHILPVLTVTALAAAASAQTAPAPAAKQSLSYNRVVASWVNTSGDLDGLSGLSGVSVLGQAKLGSSNLYVSATAFDLDADINGNEAVLGYAYSLPVVLGVSTDLNIEVGLENYGLGLRALIGGGVELGVAYAHDTNADDTLTVSASYNLGFAVKGLSLNASYATQTGTTSDSTDITSVGIGYNF